MASHTQERLLLIIAVHFFKMPRFIIFSSKPNFEIGGCYRENGITSCFHIVGRGAGYEQKITCGAAIVMPI